MYAGLAGAAHEPASDTPWRHYGAIEHPVNFDRHLYAGSTPQEPTGGAPGTQSLDIHTLR